MRRDSWRNSKHSLASTDRATQTEDIGTQTLFEEPMDYANDHYHPVLSGNSNGFTNNFHNRDYHNDNDSNQPYTDSPHNDHPHEQETDTETLHEEDVHEAAAAQAAPKRLSLRARLVTIPKRIPPALPPRNPNRGRPSSVDLENGDVRQVRNDDASSNDSSDYDDKETGREISLPSSVLSDRRDMDGFDDVVLDSSDGLTQALSEANANNLPSHDPHSHNQIHDDATITHNHEHAHDHDYTKSPPLNPHSTLTEPEPDTEPTTSLTPPPNPLETITTDHERVKEREKGEFHSVPNTSNEVVRIAGGIPGAW